MAEPKDRSLKNCLNGAEGVCPLCPWVELGFSDRIHPSLIQSTDINRAFLAGDKQRAKPSGDPVLTELTS